jgi:uncharacterized membrane protein YheB (UPF0754 family)
MTIHCALSHNSIVMFGTFSEYIHWTHTFISLIHSPIAQTNEQTNHQSLNQSIKKSRNQEINKSINQEINKSINQSINKSTNQPINSSVPQFFSSSVLQFFSSSVPQFLSESSIWSIISWFLDVYPRKGFKSSRFCDK